ncbi:MAG: DEAD/DEAH box helicase, partial [Antricoccus sp.]
RRDNDDRPRRDFNDRPRQDLNDRPRRDNDDRPRRDFNDRPRRDNDDRPRRDFNDRPRRNSSDSATRPDRSRSSFDRSGDANSRSFAPRGNRPQRHDEPRFEEGIDELTPIAGKLAVEVGSDNAFTEMGLPDRLVGALAQSGIAAPFAIQGQAIPSALAGRDVLARAATGSGKTLAFGLPLIASLIEVPRAAHQPHGIVLVPTRELAMQVIEALAPLGKSVGLKMVLIAGGMPYKKQLDALAFGVDILVATPGRLIDLIERGAADLSAVRISVLDEADQMCDMGFAPDMNRILERTPQGSQRMMFSATLDGDVDKIAKRFLIDPIRHSTAEVKASIESMEHHVFVVHPGRKNELTAELASSEGRTIVFVRTKMGADRVAEKLRYQGINASALHGGLGQGARTRTLSAFRDGHVPVLVATDVAARGIHIDDVQLIIQADPPTDHKTYLHRAGRTARAGGSGSVVTLAMPRERGGVERTMRMAGLPNIKGVYVEPGDAPVEQITGGNQPSGEPVAEYRAPAPARRPGGRPGQGGNRANRSGRPRRRY